MNIMGRTLVAAALCLPLAAQAEELDITRDVAADATITVSNIAGLIEISTWNRNQVHLTGYTGRNQELKISETDSGISFEVDHIVDERDSDESELVLVVPEGASIVASGVSADVTIVGSRGASVSAESVSGDVEVEASADRVELSAVSGDITFTGSSPRIAAETVSGDIDLHGVSGELNVQTVSGDAEVEGERVRIGKFESVSGTLELSLSTDDGARLVISNMSGDVVLSLPSSQSAEFSAQSFSGDISSDFGSVENERFGPGSKLKYASGNSGTSIRVESFSGDIDIVHK